MKRRLAAILVGDVVGYSAMMEADEEGITRATVLEICATEKVPCTETDLTLDDVYRADEMFCTGTMGELAGVTKVDGHIIGAGTVGAEPVERVGSMTKRLSELYVQRTASEGVQVVEEFAPETTGLST
jgi:branched-chain amino acid aminotransferase